MDIWQWINGYVEVELVSGDALGSLRVVSDAGVVVKDGIVGEDTITASFRVSRQDLRKLYAIAGRNGYVVRVIQYHGSFWLWKDFLHRPVLIGGFLVLFALTLFLPTRVLFIQIEGNENVSACRIQQVAEDYGLYIGASRQSVRNEILKNGLLASIPELQWVGVNTAGCVATVTVQERINVSEQERPSYIASMVAARDSIILSCTATSGNLLCRVGQVVRAGDVLISGYLDIEKRLGGVYAQGEIYGQTNRQLSAVTVTEVMLHEETGAVEKKYRLKFGKKLINFYKGSGISGGSCDKIYVEKYMTLPGGFVLPVSVIQETVVYYSTTADTLTDQKASDILDAFVSWYLPEQMVAGHILDRLETRMVRSGLFCLEGYYACSEMIGQVKIEEN